MPPSRAASVWALKKELDHLFADTFKDLRALSGEFGEDLAVESEAVFLQLRDECGIRPVAGLADGGIQADYPELAEDRLLVATVGEGVAAGAHKRLMGKIKLLRADAAIALRPFEHIVAPFKRLYPSFDSCHT